MDFDQTLLNFVAIIATIAAFFFLSPPYILFKLLCHIARSISKENVAGKVVLIVGASSGIGEHVAYEYARRGARLVLAARREKSLREVADVALSLGAPEAIAIPADVSNIDDCKRLIDQTIDRFGQLNHLVNCAGVTSMCMLEEIPDITKFTPVMAEMSIVPIARVAASAMAIVDGACRGDSYLAEPPWVKTTIWWVAFLPEVVQWMNRWFLVVDPPSGAPSKLLLDVPGVKHLAYPASVWSPVIKED